MKCAIFATALVGSSLVAAGAEAQTLAALVGNNAIAIVDVATGKVQKSTRISGIAGKLVGIDVRPSDGMLYGVAADGTVVTIDPSTGKAMLKSKLDTALPEGAMATVDFNPAADRLRIIGADGTNLRANVDDGKVTKDGSLRFADGDMLNGKAPRIVAGAYTNAMKGAKETTLYDVDATGTVLKQAPPNDGVLNSIGPLGMTGENAAFDIVSDGNGGNEAWLLSGATLYRVDLATGKSVRVAKIAGIKGKVSDIAALPKAM